MAKQKKNIMTREEAEGLYRDLRKALETVQQRKAQESAKGSPLPKMQAKPEARAAAISSAAHTAVRLPVMNRGHYAAFAFVLLFASAKAILSGLSTFNAVATQDAASDAAAMIRPVMVQGPTYSKEEVRLLTSLDARRTELEEKSKRIDERDQDLRRAEQEYAARLTQIRDLTDRLKQDREKNEKKRNAQIDQLANVYGSMSPNEAAELIEQLDITIALSLLERMPEKRIGQILALMSAEKALTITRMMSERSKG